MIILNYLAIKTEGMDNKKAIGMDLKEGLKALVMEVTLKWARSRRGNKINKMTPIDRRVIRNLH